MSNSKDNKDVSAPATEDRSNSSPAFLDLPDHPEFVSDPPDIPVWANIKLCELMLPAWNKRRIEMLSKITEKYEEFYL